MKFKNRYLALALGVALVGCATQPNAPQTATAPSVQMDEFGSPMTRQYVIQAAKSDPVEIKGVTASSSSTRDPRWFDVNNVIDGNTHSAWGPAHDDGSPMLTLDLGGTFTLSSLAIKMSDAPATFDVAVWLGGEWKTIATDVKPTYGALDSVDLPDRMTNKVRLTFNNTGEAQLLLCEVKAFTDRQAKPSPVPTVLPTVMPTVQPSAPPSQTPPPQEIPSCAVLIGSGTQLLELGDNRAEVYSFNFNIQTSADGPAGTFRVFDEGGSGTGADYTLTSFTSSGGTLTLRGSSQADANVEAELTISITSQGDSGVAGFVSQLVIRSTADGMVTENLTFPSLSTVVDPAGQEFAFGLVDTCDVASPDEDCLVLNGTATIGISNTGLPQSPPDRVVTLKGVAQTESGVSGTVRIGFATSGDAEEGPVTSIDVDGDNIVVSGIAQSTGRLPGGIRRYEVTLQVISRDGDNIEAAPVRIEFSALTDEDNVLEVTTPDGAPLDDDITGTASDCD